MPSAEEIWGKFASGDNGMILPDVTNAFKVIDCLQGMRTQDYTKSSFERTLEEYD